MQQLKDHDRLVIKWLCAMIPLAWVATGAVCAQTVVLHLKDGDQITGVIVSENSNQVVISNAWVKTLAVPLAEISKRETKKATKTTAPASALAKKKAETKKPEASLPKAIAKTPSAEPPTKLPGTWHGDFMVGLDAFFGTKKQQSYSGRASLTYLQPYKANPKKFFRNTTKVGAEYQETDGQESANRANGSNKSDFDMWDSYYAYGLAGAGYDDIRKIDFKYQIGPGGGAHLVKQKKFVLNAESGLSYEAQYRKDTDNLETFYLRLAQDFTWQMRKNLKLTENLAFYPNLESVGQYHNDFTSTLSYGFWEHMSLNLTVADEYNTELAPGVEPNQFEVRVSLGYNF